MIVDILEDTLNGGYRGLFGEVVLSDQYRLRSLQFVPDLVIDAGSNVGIFTRFAKMLFPKALIVCIEPDKENFHHLTKFTNSNNIIFINKAIGNNEIVRRIGAENGAHESYVSVGTAMDEVVSSGEQVEATNVQTIMLDELINEYVKPGMKSLLKLDIELNEVVVWDHKPSMEAMKRVDYICGEAHWTMLKGEVANVSRNRTLEALHSFESTHHVRITGTDFWLTKK